VGAGTLFEQLTLSAVPQPPGGAIRLEWENTPFCRDLLM
jgi:hypothetical protein